MAQSEKELEDKLIKQLKEQGFKSVTIKDENDLLENLKLQIETFNRIQLTDQEFKRIVIHLEGGSIFDKAHKLRDKYELIRDDGDVIYVKFFDSKEWCKNRFQVTNQITVNGVYTNRYDVTILINGLPLVQIELKKRGIELKEAYNQIKRYDKHSYRGLFNYIQIFILAWILTSIGIVGDLLESAVKRSHGVKDMGRWLKGHGGIIDRIDSLMLAVPAFWLIYRTCLS